MSSRVFRSTKNQPKERKKGRKLLQESRRKTHHVSILRFQKKLKNIKNDKNGAKSYLSFLDQAKRHGYSLWTCQEADLTDPEVHSAKPSSPCAVSSVSFSIFSDFSDIFRDSCPAEFSGQQKNNQKKERRAGSCFKNQGAKPTMCAF